MKSNLVRRFLQLAVLPIALATLLSGCQSAKRSVDPPSGSGSLFDTQQYRSERLSRLTELWQKSPSTASPLLFAGDFSSRKGEQIALVDGDRIEFFGDRGAHLKSVQLPSGSFGAGLVADVSQDGKSDLVLGGWRSNSARLLAVDADGHLLFDQSFQNMVRGTTRPSFYRDGSVYFTAYSEFNISPKMVGAFDVGDQRLKWSTKMIQVPLALSMGSDGLFAVSNRAVGRDTGGRPIASSTGGNRQAVVVYDLSGKRRAYHPFGAVSKEGYFVKGQIASVSLKLADLVGRQTPSVLELIRRPSSLYEGNAEFRIASLGGKVQQRLEGPPRTGGNFGFYSTGSGARIVIAWNTAGELLVTDGGLHVLHKLRLSGSLHDTRLLQIGRFDGSGAVEYLVADANRLYVFDESLKVVFSTAFNSSVRQATFLRSSEGRASLAVLAGRLHVFGETPDKPSATLAVYTDPPGAAVSIDGRSFAATRQAVLRDLSVGPHTITASIGSHTARETVNLEPGRLTETTLQIEGVAGSAKAIQNSRPESEARSPSIPAGSYADLRLLSHVSIPPGFRLSATADFTGDAKEELLLVDPKHFRYLLYNSRLSLVGNHPYHRSPTLPWVVRNLTGNGKADIVVRGDQRPYTLFGYSGDGRLVFEKFFSNGFDGQLYFQGWIGNKMVIRIVTGYLLSPRGFYLFDPKTNRIDSFSPVAGFMTWVNLFDNKIYPDYYTPNNGATIVHPNGSVEIDSRIYLDVFTRDGKWLPESQPLETPNPMGNAIYFPFDADHDGKPELYFLVSKDAHYNTGRPGIYRFDGSSPPKAIVHGPMNSVAYYDVLNSGGHSELAIGWQATKTLELFGKDFSVLAAHTFQKQPNLFFLNLNGDSRWERVELSGGIATIVTFSGSPIRSFSLPNDTVEQVMTADLFQNGKQELILKGKKTIAIYGY